MYSLRRRFSWAANINSLLGIVTDSCTEGGVMYRLYGHNYTLFVGNRKKSVWKNSDKDCTEV